MEMFSFLNSSSGMGSVLDRPYCYDRFVFNIYFLITKGNWSEVSKKPHLGCIYQISSNKGACVERNCLICLGNYI